MFKKSLATFLPTIATLCGLSAIFIVSGLVVNNPLLVSPALAKATNYLKAIDKYVPCDIYKICESTKIQPDPILPNISPVDVPQPKPPKPVRRRIPRF